MKETVKINSIDHYGRGISKIHDKIVFIKNALVNEEVEIIITENKKKYCEANVDNYVKKSQERVIPRCPYYGVCGGCNIMHMSYDKQLLFKENKVREILAKFAKIEDNIKPIIGSDEFNYRNKITLQINKNLGLYKDASYDIVSINECLISDNNINKIITKLNKMDLNSINQIIIRVTKLEEIMLVLCLSGRIDEKYFVNEFKGYCTSIIKKDKKNYKTLFGKDYITEIMGDYKFNISADSFFQVNTNQAIKMYDLVKNYVDKVDSVLDLYCGTGTIGIYLSKNVKKLTGIEINKYAVKDANNNAKLNDIKNTQFLCGDVKDLIGKIRNIDAIIVDPPRSGLDSDSIKHILNIKPKKIIYVSCDPVTLARDLSILKEFYEVKEISPIDMFPNTYHVENVCFLRIC